MSAVLIVGDTIRMPELRHEVPLGIPFKDLLDLCGGVKGGRKLKQGRGEWKVKQPAQQPLAARSTALRSELGDVRFDFAPTEDVLGLIDAP